MATKVYKLIDLFRDFYILFVNYPTGSPSKEENLDALVRLLSDQLRIVNSDTVPEDIPAPIQNFFNPFLRMLYFDRKAVRYVCEKVIQFHTDRSSVDQEDKLLHSHIRKIINQLSRDETIEIETSESPSVFSIQVKLSYVIAIPWALEIPFLNFFREKFEKNGFYLAGASLPMGSGKCGFIIENICKENKDKLFPLFEEFANEFNLSVETHDGQS